MTEYVDFAVGDSGLSVRWFRQHGTRKQATLMRLNRATGELESLAMLTVAQAEALSDVAGVTDEDLYGDAFSGALEDDQQIPQESTVPAIEPFCEPCET